MTIAAINQTRINRRRFITIAAAFTGAGAIPRSAFGSAPATYTWKGIALGAEASLVLQHRNEGEAKAVIATCLAEVARLESIFSLHRLDSALVRLNRDGRLDEAPNDLRVLLSEALAVAERSDGAFDPTIQPLWALYAEHFRKPKSDPNGPSAEQIASARRLVDWRKVKIAGTRIILLERGMAITLNGIAQGYITDKIGQLLREMNFVHVLVNMGEQLAIGPKWDGEQWKIGISSLSGEGAVIETFALQCGAVATSGGYGCRFDEAGRFAHIFDPRSGAGVRHFESVTVVADRALWADGLSTALTVVPRSRWPALRSARERIYAVPFGATAGLWL